MNEVKEKNSIGSFLKETRAEMKKVTWPTKNEVTKSTGIIIIIMLFFGFMIGFMDVGFSQVIKTLIRVF